MSTKNQNARRNGEAGDMRDLVFVDGPQSDRIRDLVAYWNGKRGERFAPGRADIDPAEIPHHLSQIFMLDVIDGGADFRYRLIGTGLVAGLGRDATGQRVSELYASQPLALSKIRKPYLAVVEQRRPIYVQGRVFWLPTSDFRRFEGVLLPLSSDASAIDIILSEISISWSPS